MHITHGLTRKGRRAPEHYVWHGMIDRCTRENHPAWCNYGGRGILVCERWRHFRFFLEDMGRRPSPNHTLDRIDNSKGYGPGNCRWATRLEQHRNERRNVNLTFLGRTQCVAAWAEEVGLHRNTILRRIKRGWSIEDAISKANKRR
jgi:hypothetical protein